MTHTQRGGIRQQLPKSTGRFYVIAGLRAGDTRHDVVAATLESRSNGPGRPKSLVVTALRNQIRLLGFSPFPYEVGVSRTLKDWEGVARAFYPEGEVETPPEVLATQERQMAAHRRRTTANNVARAFDLPTSITVGVVRDAETVGIGTEAADLVERMFALRKLAETIRAEADDDERAAREDYYTL